MALSTDALGTARSCRHPHSPHAVRTANEIPPAPRPRVALRREDAGLPARRASTCARWRDAGAAAPRRDVAPRLRPPRASAARARLRQRSRRRACDRRVVSRRGRPGQRVCYHVHLYAMTNSAPETFDAHAAAYEAPRRRLIPPFDAFYGTAVDVLRMLPAPPRRVLDLGAGTGMLAARVAAAYPEAELVLVDGAPAMLEQARAHARRPRDAARRRPRRPAARRASSTRSSRRWRSTTSTTTASARCSPASARRSRPAACSSTPSRSRARRPASTATTASGTRPRPAPPAPTTPSGPPRMERMRHDQPSDVESQLRWLREAGFDAADCVFKDHRFAVLVAHGDGVNPHPRGRFSGPDRRATGADPAARGGST